VQGVVCHDYSFNYCHFEAQRSLHEWMASEDIPGIYGIDTRALTKKIREHGTLLGKIVPAGQEALTPFVNPNLRNLVAETSRKSRQVYVKEGGGDIDILAVDCGMKDNIIRQLVNRGARVTVVPWNHDITKEK